MYMMNWLFTPLNTILILLNELKVSFKHCKDYVKNFCIFIEWLC